MAYEDRDERDRGFMHTERPTGRGPNWRAREIELSAGLLKKLVGEARAGRRPVVEIVGWEGRTKKDKPYISLKIGFAEPYVADRRDPGRREYDRGERSDRGGDYPDRRSGRERLPPREVRDDRSYDEPATRDDLDDEIPF